MQKAQERKNKIISLLIGSAVGDALGVPFEFMSRDSFECRDMVGYGTHNQPEGTWSDDTSLTLCLAETIAEGFDISLLADKFRRWLMDDYLTAHDSVFDVGNATSRAIRNIERGITPTECGGKNEMDNGNGSLMRIAPLVFYSTKFEDVKAVSSITHAHELAVESCYILVKFLEHLLKGEDKKTAYILTSNIGVDKKLKSRLVPNLAELPEREIMSGGYVLDTLQASLWCFLTTDSYKDAVLKAVNLGEDTDTTACVTGAIAGLYYGVENIPIKWINTLARKDLILDIAERMSEKCVEG